MRTLRLLLTATALLALAACSSDNSSTLPEPTITSVNPTSLEAGAEITITGANYYAINGPANTRVEVCGVTVTADLVEPVTRTVLLPPGDKITAQVGTELTATIPAEGFTPGVNDVRVIRPDGASVTLKDAVTCAVPAPEEPVITSFTAPAAVELGQAVAFTWDITNEDDSDLTCSLNSGDETGVITLADCTEPFEHTYAAVGTFTAELTVTDEHEQSDKATHTVTVSDATPVIPTAPGITEFTGPHNVLLGGRAVFTWVITNPDGSDLTCTLDPGDETGVITLDDCDSPFEYTYTVVDKLTATLTVTDRHDQSATAEHDVTISLRPAPVVTAFTAVEAAFRDDTINFIWAVDYSGDDELTCTFNPGDETTDQTVDCSDGELAYQYATAGDHTAMFTVTDEHAQTDTAEHEISITHRPAPRITGFWNEEPAFAADYTLFNWVIEYDGDDDLTCSFNPGDGSGPHNVDCLDGDLLHGYGDPGPYPVELTVKDEHGQTSTSGYLLTVFTTLPASVINSFTATDPIIEGQPMTFTWEVSYARPQDLECEIIISSGPTYELDDCISGALEHTFDTVGPAGAYLGVRDAQRRVTSLDLPLSVHPITPPAIRGFTADARVLTNTPMTFEWTIDYEGDKAYLTCIFSSGDNDYRPVDCLPGELQHTYTTKGSRRASLTVSGPTGSYTDDHNVSVDTPTPSFTISLQPEHLEPEVTITGPNGFAATGTVTHGDEINVPEPGDYTLSVPRHIEEDILLLGPNDSRSAGINNWDLQTPATVTITPSTVEPVTAAIQYEQRLQTVDIGLNNMSGNGVDLSQLDFVITVERHSDESAGQWDHHLELTGAGAFQLPPGIYRFTQYEIRHHGYESNRGYDEVYMPRSGGVSIFPVYRASGIPAQIKLQYDLVPGQLEVNLSGVPEGQSPSVLFQALDGSPAVTMQPDDIPPGVYLITGDSLETTEVFDDQNDIPQDVNFRYETNFTLVPISSGINDPVNLTYSVIEGIFRVGIYAPESAPDSEVEGNITFTRLSDNYTFTVTDQTDNHPTLNTRHFEEHPPGFYRIEIEDVPAAGGHNGYRPVGGKQTLHHVLHSPEASSTHYDVVIDVRYEPIPAP